MWNLSCGNRGEDRRNQCCAEHSQLLSKRYARVSVLFFFWALSCTTGTGGSGGVFYEVSEAPRAVIDPEVEDYSKALHHYLVGRLELTQEDFPAALSHFSEASKLYKGDSPSLNAKLAELNVRAGNLDEALAACKKALEQDPDDLQMRFLYAGILETMGNDAEAQKVYEAIVGQKGDNFDAYVLLSALHLKNKRFDESIAVLKKLEQHTDQKALAYYYLGHTYELKLDLQKAEVYYLKALELEPRATNVVADLLRVYLGSGDIEKARTFAQSVLQKDPGNILARKVLSQMYMGQSQFDEALKHLQVLKDEEQDPTETRFKIALIQIEKQNFPEALRELLLVLAANPKHSEARFYLGSLYAAAGKNEEAVIELEKIEPGQENYIKSRTFSAFILRQQGELEKAEKAIREALTEDADNDQVFSYLVLVLRDAGKLKVAREVLEERVEKKPDDPNALFQLGVVLSDLGDESGAREKMEKVLLIKPDQSDALNFIAYSLAESETELDRALHLVQRALQYRPNDGYYTDTLGWVYYHMGNYAEAVVALEQAVKLAGNDIVILEHYGDALVKADDKDRAIRVYKTCLALTTDKTSKEHQAALERIRKKLVSLGVTDLDS